MFGANDKPTCYGFTMFKRPGATHIESTLYAPFLTKKILKQELRDFVRSYFTGIMNNPSTNTDDLIDACNNYALSLASTDAAPLKIFDIDTYQQGIFYQYLTNKYGSQFCNNPEFVNFLNDAFKIDCSIIENMHAFKFAALVDLEELLSHSNSIKPRN